MENQAWLDPKEKVDQREKVACEVPEVSQAQLVMLVKGVLEVLLVQQVLQVQLVNQVQQEEGECQDLMAQEDRKALLVKEE